MITANDVFRQTMKRPEPMVDDIITKELIPRFERTTELFINVDCKVITDGYGIQKEFFIKQMNMRGFYVEVKGVDDRPCYKIIIPPQEQ